MQLQDTLGRHNNLLLAAGHAIAAMRFIKLLIVTVVTLAPCPAQQTPDAVAWLQFIGRELSQIRVELLEQRTVEEAGRLAGIQRELEALHTLQAQHQSEDRAQKQQLADLEKQADDSNADSEARLQIQAVRSQLASSAELTRAARNSLTAREAELNERLQATRARLQSIADRLKRLATPSR
jgi:hypothetical protein